MEEAVLGGTDFNLQKLMINNQDKTEWKKSSPLKTYSKKTTPTSDGKSRYGRSHKPRLSGDFLSTDKKVSHYLKIDVDNQMHYFKASPYAVQKTPIKSPPTGTPRRGRPPKALSFLKPENRLGHSLNDFSVKSSLPVSNIIDIEAPAPTSTETLPLPDQLIVPKDEQFSDSEELINDGDWNVGDLAWACVGGFPYWPCAITKDPIELCFKKIKILGKNRQPKECIHVRFFGDRGRRSWIMATHILPFHGLDSFLSLAEETCTAIVKKKDPRLYRSFTVLPSVRKAWQAAVSEAESLIEAPRHERVTYFMNLYPPTPPSEKEVLSTEGGMLINKPEPKKRGRKRKSELSVPSPIAEKKIKFDIAEEPQEPAVAPVLAIAPSSLAPPPPLPVPIAAPAPSTFLPVPEQTIKREPLATAKESPRALFQGHTLIPEKSTLPASEVKVEIPSPAVMVSTQEPVTPSAEEQLDEQVKSEVKSAPTTGKKRGRPPGRRKQVKEEDYDFTPLKRKYIKKSSNDQRLRENRAKRKTLNFDMRKMKKLRDPAYEMFYEKNFDRVSDENPELSEEDIDKFIEKMWKEVKEKQAGFKMRSRDGAERAGSDSGGDSKSETSSRSDSPPPLILPSVKTVFKRGISLFSGAKGEKVCQVCFKGGDVLKCRGPCGQQFHIYCADKPRYQSVTEVEVKTEENIIKKKRGRPRKSIFLPPLMNASTDEIKPAVGSSEEMKLAVGSSEEMKPAVGISEEIKPAVGISEEIKPAVGISEVIKPVVGNDEEIKPAVGISEEIKPAVDISEVIKPVVGNDEDIKPVVNSNDDIKPVVVDGNGIRLPVVSNDEDVKPIFPDATDEETKQINAISTVESVANSCIAELEEQMNKNVPDSNFLPEGYDSSNNGTISEDVDKENELNDGFIMKFDNNNKITKMRNDESQLIKKTHLTFNDKAGIDGSSKSVSEPDQESIDLDLGLDLNDEESLSNKDLDDTENENRSGDIAETNESIEEELRNSEFSIRADDSIVSKSTVDNCEKMSVDSVKSFGESLSSCDNSKDSSSSDESKIEAIRANEIENARKDNLKLLGTLRGDSFESESSNNNMLVVDDSSADDRLMIEESPQADVSSSTLDPSADVNYEVKNQAHIPSNNCQESQENEETPSTLLLDMPIIDFADITDNDQNEHMMITENDKGISLPISSSNVLYTSQQDPNSVNILNSATEIEVAIDTPPVPSPIDSSVSKMEQDEQESIAEEEKESSQEVNESSQEVEEPSQEVNESSQEVNESSQEVNESSQEVKESSQEVKESSQEVKESFSQEEKVSSSQEDKVSSSQEEKESLQEEKGSSSGEDSSIKLAKPLKKDEKENVRRYSKVGRPKGSGKEGGKEDGENSSKNSDTDSDKTKNKGWMCKLCSEGKFGPCFICGQDEDDRLRCGYCGKVYHLKCAKEWPQSQISETAKGRLIFHCPQHVCHTCISDNPSSVCARFTNDRLVRCVKCPSTYHYGNYCIPAGSEILSMSQIICPKHYVPHRKGLHHVNASWCFICAIGGSLICCDLCPNSFHAECLKINPPEGAFICEDCETGRYPLFGEIVWVKLGTYRWWPAKILYPQEVPENINQLAHTSGEFAVEFFGTHDYYWVNRGRVFLYHEGDGCKIVSKSRVDELFTRGVQEASDAFLKWSEERANREATSRPSMKPPKYVKILSNRIFSNVNKNQDAKENVATTCDCDPSKPNPCGPESDCINRLLMVECSPHVCPAGENCCNQNFEKRNYPNLVPYKTESRGWGLKTLDPIPKGGFIIEYVGEMIDEEEYRKRLTTMQQNKDENFYFLTIDKDRMLDAGPKGNVARFMNHSCEPNCETQKWTVNGDTRVGLFALIDIKAGTELVFNYNLETIGNTKVECKCGSAKCAGYIGAKNLSKANSNKPKNREGGSDDKKAIRKKKRKPAKVNKHTEDTCFTCGNGGELLLCDDASCPKAYHLTCLGLTKHPAGGWVCPWHQCSVCCSVAKIQRCNLCINSYCTEHAEGNISLHRSHGLLCFSHNLSDSGSDWSAVSEDEDSSNKLKSVTRKYSRSKVVNGHAD